VSVRPTPLDAWTAARLGIPGDRPSHAAVARGQLERLRATLAWAAQHSPFYRPRLADLPSGWPAALADLASLPFTSPGELRDHGPRFLCVSQDEVERVVTLQSSGTTGKPKRLWFTPADQDATIEFFRVGMSTLVERGDRILILLPGKLPGSVGALLATALDRLGTVAIPHGFVLDLPAAAADVQRHGPTCAVGTPVQLLALSRYAEVSGVPLRLRTALLTTDHVPASLVRRLEAGTGCRVFEHYGMTEMSLGGAVGCEAHAGYHLREPDLLFEIVDPATGEVLPEGAEGEVVFTTLQRRAMPLIRYRTGDRSRFVPGPCPCGSASRRLAHVCGRIEAPSVPCGAAGAIAFPALDEVLFAVPGLVDFTAAVSRGRDFARLAVTAYGIGPGEHELASAARQALESVPSIQAAAGAGELLLSVAAAELPPGRWTAPRKRTIVEHGGSW
jgi:phenylacetate-coenzyme A ligase PaaK-like adenylate-forming protein